MPSWLEDIAGPNFAPAVLWTLLALVVLVIVLVIVRIVRSMTFGTFVAGGRNRKTRLAVMDAAAVDSQRRLVLVRRDDVEHLILIGGPTDVVVERDIRLHALDAPSRAARRSGRRSAGGAPAPAGTSLAGSPRAAPARSCPRSGCPTPAGSAARKGAGRTGERSAGPHAVGRACPAAEFLDAAPLSRDTVGAGHAVRAKTAAAGFRQAGRQSRRRARQEEAGNVAGRRDEPAARRAFEQALEHRTT